MISLHVKGVVVRNTIGPQYRKAHVLCKQGLWTGYIPSSQTTQLDILTYATFLWTGNSINHTGTWSEIINPLHLNCFVANTSNIPITYTLSDNTSINTPVSVPPNTTSINTLCYYTTLYISHLAISIPEKYPQNNIWVALLRSIIHLQQQQWLHAWLTFEMSIFDESFNHFHYRNHHKTHTSTHQHPSPPHHNSNNTSAITFSHPYTTLISHNYHKIAPYANKSALYYRHKLSQAYKNLSHP